jgi:hypothetical protein
MESRIPMRAHGCDPAGTSICNIVQIGMTAGTCGAPGRSIQVHHKLRGSAAAD